MKKQILILILIFSLCITGCKNKNQGANERKAKEIYVHKTPGEILTAIGNKETFVLFVKDDKNDESKKMSETLITSANRNDLESIYYIDSNDEHLDDLLNYTRESDKVFAMSVLKGNIQDYTNQNDTTTLDIIVKQTQEVLTTCNDDCPILEE